MKNMDFVYGFSNATVYDKAGMYVNITIVICIAIVILALIAAWTILRCRKKDAEMKSAFESQKKAWEKEDANNKIKAEIISKKISFLEEYVKKDSKLKDLTKEQCQEYLNMLDNLVKSQKTDQTTSNEE